MSNERSLRRADRRRRHRRQLARLRARRAARRRAARARGPARLSQHRPLGRHAVRDLRRPAGPGTRPCQPEIPRSAAAGLHGDGVAEPARHAASREGRSAGGARGGPLACAATPGRCRGVRSGAAARSGLRRRRAARGGRHGDRRRGPASGLSARRKAAGPAGDRRRGHGDRAHGRGLADREHRRRVLRRRAGRCRRRLGGRAWPAWPALRRSGSCPSGAPRS